MVHTETHRSEFQALLKLAIPVVVVQVGMLAMGFVDVAMVGQLDGDEGMEALATVGLANFYSFVLMIFGVGMLMALDPVLSQAVGAKDEASLTRNIQRGIVMALALSVPITLCHLPVEFMLGVLGQPPELIPKTGDYVLIVAGSVVPFLGFVVFRLSLQAYSRMAPIVWTIVLANVLNVVLNYMWIYGELGFERQGVVGSAWATLVCRWVMMLAMILLGWRTIAHHMVPWSRQAFDLERLRKLGRLGLPLGLQLMMEYGAFGGTMVFMGWFGSQAQSGHQIAISLATISYMVPLGISFAAAVRVGYGVGARRMQQSRWAAWTSVMMAIAVMLVFAAVFILIPEPLARMFTGTGATLEIAVLLIPIAGIFQISDGLQVVGIGILRGAGDTRAAMIANVWGFWITGLPIGLVMARPWGFDMGPSGHWWGLLIGLTVVAAFLMLRVYYRLGGDVARTDV